MYQAGSLNSVELTDKAPWEPYSSKFAATEEAARSAKTVMAVRVTYPRDHDPQISVREEEEDDTCNWRSPVLTERCVAVVSRLMSQQPIELCDCADLASKLVAAVNVESFDVNGDGLTERPEDSLCCSSEEERQAFAPTVLPSGQKIRCAVRRRRNGKLSLFLQRTGDLW
jgi:hypothetical protein